MLSGVISFLYTKVQQQPVLMTDAMTDSEMVSVTNEARDEVFQIPRSRVKRFREDLAHQDCIVLPLNKTDLTRVAWIWRCKTFAFGILRLTDYQIMWPYAHPSEQQDFAYHYASKMDLDFLRQHCPQMLYRRQKCVQKSE